MVTQAEFGLEFLRCIAQDDRLSRADLAEIIGFAASSFGGDVDADTAKKAQHAGALLCKGYASSRGSRDLADLSDRFAKYPPISQADFKASLAWMDRMRPRAGESEDERSDRIKKLIHEDEANGKAAPTDAQANANANAILAAYAKSTTAPVVELPSEPNARAIILADMRARGETPPKGRL